MNSLITIEYQNQRILSTAQLAEAYEADQQIIVNNFNRNKDRYTEGKHYFLLDGTNLKDFRAKNQIDLPPNLNKYYLWTEKGAWLHAKSLNTDQAWEAYEMLVDEYYRISEANTKIVNMTEYQKSIIKTRESNAKVREANILLKIASGQNGTYRQVLESYATKIITGEHLLPLPEATKKTYSATEIGEQLGISSNMVGTLANRHNLKTEEYGKIFHDKSRYSSKEVESFRYYDGVIPVIKSLLVQV